MRRSAGRLWAAALVAGFLVAACSSGTPTGGSTGGGGGSSAGAGSSGGGSAGGGAAGGGKAASIDACSLLSQDEIKGVIGTAVGPGVLQTTDTQADCEWSATEQGKASAAGLIVQDFDADLWNALSSAGQARKVTGIGEAAFADEPHAGDLSVKTGAYEVDVAIIDFTRSTDQVDAESLQLAKLVLPRLGQAGG